jgi:hypothetical protein
LLLVGYGYLSPQKINVKQFKDDSSSGTAEGVGFKRQKLLFQRRHSTIYIFLLAEEAP